MKELRPKANTTRLRQQVLSSHTLLASKKKPDAEQALQKSVGIGSGKVSRSVSCGSYVVTERFHSCTTAHMILKQTPKACNQLKRISKLP